MLDFQTVKLVVVAGVAEPWMKPRTPGVLSEHQPDSAAMAELVEVQQKLELKVLLFLLLNLVVMVGLSGWKAASLRHLLTQK